MLWVGLIQLFERLREKLGFPEKKFCLKTSATA